MTDVVVLHDPAVTLEDLAAALGVDLEDVPAMGGHRLARLPGGVLRLDGWVAPASASGPTAAAARAALADEVNACGWVEVDLHAAGRREVRVRGTVVP